METACWFHSYFWHFFQRHALIQSFTIKSKTRTQHNLTLGTVHRVNWHELFSINGFIWWIWPFFFILVNYLWTDCDHTNKLGNYSRRFSILKQYFMSRPLANLLFRLIIHTTTGVSPSVLLKHHLMHPREFHSGSFLWIHIHCKILCVYFYMYD